jgi:chorismate mutase
MLCQRSSKLLKARLGLTAKRGSLISTKGDIVRMRAVRAVRGAIQVDRDDRELILSGTAELITEVLERNQLGSGDVISMVFTATPDLTAEFPAYAARQLGLTDVPLLCATEIAVPGALPRVLRVLAHVESERARSEIRHVYLRGAAQLRTDLPQ